MTANNRKGNGNREMERARQSLAAAAEDLAAGRLPEAASHAYYAVFHAVRAALFGKGIQTRRHSGHHEMFHKELIHKGLFPKTLGNILTGLFEKRMVADYGRADEVDAAFTPESSARLVAQAEEFVAAVDAWVKAQWEKMGDE